MNCGGSSNCCGLGGVGSIFVFLIVIAIVYFFFCGGTRVSC